jgi:chromosome segregation ATPase
MARSGVTREQVFETADALVREGQNPTVVAVRTRLGGGSPNTITPLLGEWKTLNEHKRAEAMSAAPEPVEAVMRQVWGTAWQQAQAQLEGEREALSLARKEIERERAEMLAEIARMDADLETVRDTIRERDEALEAERHAHEQAASEAREVRALAEERGKRILAKDRELAALRGQIEALRIEAATLTERASHMDELRAMFKALQEQQGRGEDTGKPRAASKRRARPEG